MENKPDMPDAVNVYRVKGSTGEWLSLTPPLSDAPHIPTVLEMATYTRAPAERDGVDVEKALLELVRFAERQICEHTETHRGGAIWEICNQCGCRWADDEGGKPEFVEPVEITNARNALDGYLQPQPRLEGKRRVPDWNGDDISLGYAYGFNDGLDAQKPQSGDDAKAEALANFNENVQDDGTIYVPRHGLTVKFLTSKTVETIRAALTTPVKPEKVEGLAEWQDFAGKISDMLWGGELGWTRTGLEGMIAVLKERLSTRPTQADIAEVRALVAEIKQASGRKMDEGSDSDAVQACYIKSKAALEKLQAWGKL